MEIVILLLLALFLWVLVMPFYVLAKLSELTKEIERLNREVNDWAVDRQAMKTLSQPHATHIPLTSEVPSVVGSPPVPDPKTELPPQYLPSTPMPNSVQPVAVKIAPVVSPPIIFPDIAPPIPPSVLPSIPPSVPSSSPVPSRDWESIVGANWLAKLGVAAIAIATAFFLQYAFSSGLIGPGARVIGGLVLSALMSGIGYAMMGRPQYRKYAEALTSGGIVVYFLSVYAAYNFYHFIGFTAAFGALAIGALASSVLAAVNGSETVALICILGAFAAPALIRETAIAGQTPNLIRLYSYIVSINLWVCALLWLKKWISIVIVAFVSTWILFTSAGGVVGAGWITEGFASLFLSASIICGGMIAFAPSLSMDNNENNENDENDETAIRNRIQIGIGLILGGCIAFVGASIAALHQHGFLGVPDLILAAITLSICTAAASVFMPKLPFDDNPIRKVFGYFSAGLLAIVVLPAMASAPKTPIPLVTSAFVFSLVNYLLFIAVAIFLQRRLQLDGSDEISLALVVANAIVHVFMSSQILQDVRFHGIPMAIVWLPIAGWISLIAMKIASKPPRKRNYLPNLLSAIGLVIPLIAASIALEGGVKWELPLSSGIFTGLFVIFSLTWLGMRRTVETTQFRMDVLGALAVATAFYGLMSRYTMGVQYRGIEFPAILALGMAIWHLATGKVVLVKQTDDALIRLTYYGIAVTFVTVAIPMQLKAEFVTIAWTIEAVMLIWAGLKASEFKARAYGYIMLTIAIVRGITMDISRTPNVFQLLFNTRMLVGATLIASAYAGSWLLWKHRDRLTLEESPVRLGLIVVANLFTLIYVSVDLWDYAGMCWAATEIASARQLSLSLFWTIYALAAVIVGVWKRLKPVRIFAMGLLYLSVFKVLLYDLSDLKQPYRIVSFFTLGVILLLVSLLYTKFEERLKVDKVTVD